MKITNEQLRQIIKEELQNVLDEADELSPSQGPSREEMLEAAEALTSDNPAAVMDTIDRLKDLELTPLVQEKPDGYYFEIKKDFYDAIMRNIETKGRHDSDYDRGIYLGKEVTISEPYKKQGDSALEPGYHAIMKVSVSK
jgi:hypothetical protein